MKVLIVGGGGREHAIATKIAENPSVEKLYAAPGNGGMASICELVPLKATDVEGIVAWAKDNAIDFVVVAPDDPLCLGMVDALKAVALPAVEVHMSKVDEREPFRQVSYAGMACVKTYMGLGFEGYRQAILYLKDYLAGKEAEA